MDSEGQWNLIQNKDDDGDSELLLEGTTCTCIRGSEVPVSSLGDALFIRFDVYS